VARIKLPRFTAAVSREPSNASPSLAGLDRSGQQVAVCRATHVKAIEVLVELASLQTSFLTLDEAIKTTNLHVNALENIVNPMIENTISYI
jgi:V-type H+-transporting ATPase subunit D